MRATWLGLPLIGALLPALALAEETPRRKPGLWEIAMQRDGKAMPMGPVQICVDATNADPSQAPNEVKQNCEKIEVARDGDKFIVHSVCKFSGSTVTTNAAVSGDLNSAYRTDIHTRFDPPMMGRGEADMAVTAKWIGPCKPGQKAGLVGMPNMGAGGAPNMEELMKLRDKIKAGQQPQ